jgi:hypothetical protein
VLTAAGLFVVLLAAFAGLDMHGAVLERGRAAEQDRTTGRGGPDGPTRRRWQNFGASARRVEDVHYTDPAGRQRKAIVTPSGGSPPDPSCPCGGS